MTYRQFLTQVERGQISPFYLFEGEEEYFKKEALENLKSKLISNNKDFDYQRMNAAFHSGREILELACQLPFDNKWQIVVVEDAEKLDSKDEEIIRDYFKKPVDSTCMVLMGKKFNFQSKLYKFFKKEDKLVLFYPLREQQAINWIKDKVKKEKKSITDEAAIELYKRIGGNIFLLQSEVNKLVSFSYPQDSIEKSHVTQLIGEYVQENIFDFLQAFKQKNSSLTLHLLNRFFLQGKEPLMINNMLSREVRILFSLKLAGPKITSEKACSYIFKGKRQYSSFLLRKAKEYIEAAKKFTVPQLIFAQRRVLNAEFSIKKGKEKPDIAIQKALISIIEKTSLKI